MSDDRPSPVDASKRGPHRQACDKLRMSAAVGDRTIPAQLGTLKCRWSNEMPTQGIPHFPERVEHALAAADRLAGELSDRTAPSSGDVTSSPEYQELVRLKVILEVETARQLAETAHISAELERSSLAEKLSSARADR